MKRLFFVRPLVCVLLVLTLLTQTMLFTQQEVEAALSVTVDWNQTRQSIDGFGGSGAFKQAEDLMNFPEPARSQIVDLLFSQTSGAGLSLIRNQIGDDVAGSGKLLTIEPSPGVWNWTGDEGQIWLMNEAKKRGTTRFWSTAWSPPAWMKTNNDVANGGYLAPEHYQDYADYLSRYATEYKARFGLDIYAVSLANEPFLSKWYSSCLWTGAQFHDFILSNLKPTFQRNSVPAKVMIAEDVGWSEDWALPTLNDPNSSSRLDIVGAHNYAETSNTFSVSKSQNKRIWQTEVSYSTVSDPSITDGLRWAKQIHQFMTQFEANAWHYWWLTSSFTDGESLILLDQSTKTFSTTKRLFTMGNYSRFVRPGYLRLNTPANLTSNLYFSSYKEAATGKFTFVVINDSTSSQTFNLNMKNFKASSVTPYITSASQNLQQLSTIKVAANGTFAATIPAQSVVTYTGVKA